MKIKSKVRSGIGHILAIAIVGSVLFVAPVCGFADQARQVRSRVAPTYPDAARRAKIAGIVKIEAVIAPGGEVRSTKIVGGHPLLAQAAEEALRKWKYEPASETSTLVVQFNFK